MDVPAVVGSLDPADAPNAVVLERCAVLCMSARMYPRAMGSLRSSIAASWEAGGARPAIQQWMQRRRLGDAAALTEWIYETASAWDGNIPDGPQAWRALDIQSLSPLSDLRPAPNYDPRDESRENYLERVGRYCDRIDRAAAEKKKNGELVDGQVVSVAGRMIAEPRELVRLQRRAWILYTIGRNKLDVVWLREKRARETVRGWIDDVSRRLAVPRPASRC